MKSDKFTYSSSHIQKKSEQKLPKLYFITDLNITDDDFENFNAATLRW